MKNEENIFKGFNIASTEIYKNNKEKGFWNQSRNVGEMLMLVTSELGEAMEAHRKGRFADWEKYENLLQEHGTNTAFKESIKDTFEDEIADAIIRLLDLAGGLGIDLEKHLLNKTDFNKERPHLHGKNY
jgi:NTP pyrophosphatase (non-canonical NTP hydrolase)